METKKHYSLSPLVFTDTLHVKPFFSQMKCHCWRQRVKTLSVIDMNDMMDAHRVFMFFAV